MVGTYKKREHLDESNDSRSATTLWRMKSGRWIQVHASTFFFTFLDLDWMAIHRFAATDCGSRSKERKKKGGTYSGQPVCRCAVTDT